PRQRGPAGHGPHRDVRRILPHGAAGRGQRADDGADRAHRRAGGDRRGDRVPVLRGRLVPARALHGGRRPHAGASGHLSHGRRGVSRLFGAIRQNGYVVRDLAAAIRHWTEVIGVGPFYTVEHTPVPNAVYRGTPTDIQVSVGLAHSGPLQVE